MASYGGGSSTERVVFGAFDIDLDERDISSSFRANAIDSGEPNVERPDCMG
jgi:hypothetical protein